jgi:hypothetical protein
LYGAQWLKVAHSKGSISLGASLPEENIMLLEEI